MRASAVRRGHAAILRASTAAGVGASGAATLGAACSIAIIRVGFAATCDISFAIAIAARAVSKRRPPQPRLKRRIVWPQHAATFAAPVRRCWVMSVR